MRFIMMLCLFALLAAPAARAQSGPAVQAVPVGEVEAEEMGDPERLPVPSYIVPSRKYVPPADQRAHKDKRRWARPPAATRIAPQDTAQQGAPR